MEYRDFINQATGKSLEGYTVLNDTDFSDMKEILKDAYRRNIIRIFWDCALTPFSFSYSEAKVKVFGKTFNAQMLKIPSGNILHPIEDESGNVIGDYEGCNVVCFLYPSDLSTENKRDLTLYLLQKTKHLKESDVKNFFKDLNKPQIVQNLTEIVKLTRDRNLSDQKSSVSYLNAEIRRYNVGIKSNTDSIKQCERKISELESVEPFSEKDVKHEIEKIKKYPFVNKVTIDGKKLKVHFGRIHIRSKKVTTRVLYVTKGEYTLEMNIERSNVNVRIFNEMYRKSGTTRNNHPHVDYHGVMCEGKLHPQTYINNGNLSVAVQYLHDFLSTYNAENPFLSISGFMRDEKEVEESLEEAGKCQDKK